VEGGRDRDRQADRETKEETPDRSKSRSTGHNMLGVLSPVDEHSATPLVSQRHASANRQGFDGEDSSPRGRVPLPTPPTPAHIPNAPTPAPVSNRSSPAVGNTTGSPTKRTTDPNISSTGTVSQLTVSALLVHPSELQVIILFSNSFHVLQYIIP
jgi:hypothetical protein